MTQETRDVARQVANRLLDRQLRVVFAESCTAGLVSATLSCVPGISDWMCGSAVTYRNQTKIDWLGVRAADIDCDTAVSETVARQMASGVLSNTAEADFSVSVTGHLGPNAPSEQDGVVFVSVARRADRQCTSVGVWRHDLSQQSRDARQQEAVLLVLRRLLETLE